MDSRARDEVAGVALIVLLFLTIYDWWSPLCTMMNQLTF